MVYILIGLIGLALGSFASVLIHRLHTHEKGIFTGRSKCPKCAKQLRNRDLIPIASYLINKFKCYFCKEPIAFRYPLLELMMGGLFLLTVYLVGTEDVQALIFYLFIAFIFVLLTFYDFLFKEVPDQVSVPSFFIIVIYMLATKTMTGFSLTIGIVVAVLFFAAMHFGSRGRWLGGGDIRIGAIMGALLGWPMILTGLFFGYLTGSIFSLTGLAIGKFNRKTQIPFAPFLLLGTYLTIFWGQQSVDWYFSFL